MALSIVEYSSPDEAQKAIKELSDTPLLGRPVFIREVSDTTPQYFELSAFPDYLSYPLRIVKAKHAMVHLPTLVVVL